MKYIVLFICAVLFLYVYAKRDALLDDRNTNPLCQFTVYF